MRARDACLAMLTSTIGPERRVWVERLLEKYQPNLERRWAGRAMPTDRVMFRITPSRVRAWGLD